MCHSCRNAGPWSALEKFFSQKKSSKMLTDLEDLRKTLLMDDDYSDRWNAMEKTSQAFSNMSEELYRSILQSFSLPVCIPP